MKVGEIYKFVTKKARGHEERTKFHVYIGADHGKCFFLFINSINYFNEGFELEQKDYPFFSKPQSYIGTTSLVGYFESEIKQLSANSLVGALTSKDIADLAAFIERSEVLEQRHIHFVCTALRNI